MAWVFTPEIPLGGPHTTFPPENIPFSLLCISYSPFQFLLQCSGQILELLCLWSWSSVDLMVSWGRQQERLLCPSESCLSLCCVQTLRYVTDVGTASLEGSWPMKQPPQIRGLGTGNGSVFPSLEHDVPHSHSRGMTASLSLDIRTTFPRLQNIPFYPHCLWEK